MGEQLANTGPRAAPRNISRFHHVVLPADDSIFFERLLAPLLSLSHRLGKSVIRPKKMRILPDTMVQMLLGIPMRMVDAWSKSVNSSIEPAKLPRSIQTPFLPLDPRLHPMMIGKMGKTQGARIVRTPAKKDVTKSID